MRESFDRRMECEKGRVESCLFDRLRDGSLYLYNEEYDCVYEAGKVE